MPAPAARGIGAPLAARPRTTARIGWRRGAMAANRRFALLLTLPLTGVLLALLVYPLLYTLMLAFTSDRGRFGLANFARVFSADGFWQVVLNTAIFTVGSTALSFALGFSLAYAMEFIGAGRKVFASILIVPLAVMPVASGLTWGMMLNPALGVVDYLLRSVGLPGPGWGTQTQTALLTVMLIDVWQWTPFCFVVLHAGFQSLAREPLEAALIDGASRWQELRYVVLPMLRTVILITLVFRFMDAFKAFDTIYIVTKGGPGRASETLVIRAFMQAFQFYQPHVAAAIAVLLLVVTMLATRKAGDLVGQGIEP